jgi:hypothetical protein
LKYAFVQSDFPLILSLENHCSTEQQEKMAEILIETLGDTLFTALPTELDGIGSSNLGKYESSNSSNLLAYQHSTQKKI